MNAFSPPTALQVETENDLEWTLDGDAGQTFEILNLRKRMSLVLPERSMETVPLEGAEDASKLAALEE